MGTAESPSGCGGVSSEASGGVSLPVVPPGPGAPGPVRASRMSRWRAAVLIAVHVVLIAHVVHWWYAGRTLSPLEPSEAMYTLNDGHVNAGFVLFVVSILATLVFGRFFCGWGCHVVAYQDLCVWLLKKVGIKPKAFRSRLLVFAPLALALYMFVLPTVYRWWTGGEAPPLTNHLMTTAFWKTFPGPVIAVLTFIVCGFGIVYFLGAKGFCTYACPYGGFFGLADKAAVGRIVVSDACEHCGHCTAACSSNVRVGDEVARFGMVVDPGCMKCLDCVSVCPTNALSFGLGGPSALAKATAPPRPTPYDLSRLEEGVAVVVGIVALLSFRGLYDRIPLLMAMGIAAIAAYWFAKALHVLRRANVRFQNLQLKRGGRLTRSGVAFAALSVALAGATLHSAAVRQKVWTGGRLLRSLHLGDDVWAAGSNWRAEASDDERAALSEAIAQFEWANRWGFLATYSALQDLTWLYLADGRDAEAEASVRSLMELLPDEADPYRGLAGLCVRAGRLEEAAGHYREALRLAPTLRAARVEFGAMLVSQGRPAEALAVLREGMVAAPDQPQWALSVGEVLMELRRFDEALEVLTGFVEIMPGSAQGRTLLGVAAMGAGRIQDGIDHLSWALEIDPDQADAHYNLGYALIHRRQIDEAIFHLRRASVLDPEMAVAHYNLAVATFMAGQPGEAVGPIREAIRLVPDDAEAHGFHSVVLQALGDVDGARAARDRALELSGAE